MSVQDSEHEMDEVNISRLRFNLETGDEMPTRMSIMALATLANLNGGFDFQTCRFAF